MHIYSTNIWTKQKKPFTIPKLNIALNVRQLIPAYCSHSASDIAHYVGNMRRKCEHRRNTPKITNRQLKRFQENQIRTIRICHSWRIIFILTHTRFRIMYAFIITPSILTSRFDALLHCSREQKPSGGAESL